MADEIDRGQANGEVAKPHVHASDVQTSDIKPATFDAGDFVFYAIWHIFEKAKELAEFQVPRDLCLAEWKSLYPKDAPLGLVPEPGKRN